MSPDSHVKIGILNVFGIPAPTVMVLTIIGPNNESIGQQTPAIMVNYRVRPNEIYRIVHLLLLSSSLSKNYISIDKFRIVISFLENSKKIYRPNDKNHFSVSAGVCW